MARKIEAREPAPVDVIGRIAHGDHQGSYAYLGSMEPAELEERIVSLMEEWPEILVYPGPVLALRWLYERP